MILTNSIDPILFKESIEKNNFLIVDNFFKDYVCFLLCKRMQLETKFQDFYRDYQIINYNSQDKFTNDLSIELEYKFKHLKFLRAWSVIYNNEGSGTDFHVDPGSDITLNTWVTPDNSMKDNLKNGLILSKTFYEGDNINGIPKESGKINLNETINIPYKFNRAIFFKSNLLHKTNQVLTKKGHENKRVNYTMLFKTSAL